MAAEGLQVFLQAEIAKVFPAYGAAPFSGTVVKVDTKGEDDKPFKLHYEDGDKEWVTLQELATILVDSQLRQHAQYFVQHGVEEAAHEAKPAAAGRAAANKKRGAAEASTGNKKRKSGAAAPPAAASGGGGRGGGAGSSKQAAAAAAAHSIPELPPPPSDSGVITPEEMDGLLRDVVQEAPRRADQLHSDSQVLRLPYKGSGAATLPTMSQAVVAGGVAHFTVYGSSRSGGSLMGPDTAVYHIDYRAEMQDALARLQDMMNRLQGGRLGKQSIIRVRVYLQSIEDGLAGFKDAWNTWVEPSSPPLLTLLQGSGPFSSAGVVLEAEVHAEKDH